MSDTTHPAWRAQGFWNRLEPEGGPGRFGTVLPAQGLPSAQWVARSDALAEELGLRDWMQTDEALAVLAGNAPPVPGGAPQALATVYSGHQFGVWAGQLGDGRALLLGELQPPAPQAPAQEIQLKGAGRTPYSRGADGRAVLRSSIREFLCSEAMHALGVPTSRALAIVGSPLPVRRETVETAAVVTRVAPSFLRFGHFEHFAHTAADPAALQTLADAAIASYFPALAGQPQPYAALLQEVAERTARLMARWQALGFCHGVMNTDNMSLLGLTIDYGPFGFIDAFDPGHVCNHSDHSGRYAWNRQPGVAWWNLHALAQALLPLIEDSEAALAALQPYKNCFEHEMLAAWRAKLGLREGLPAAAEDQALLDDWLRLLAAGASDFTIAWRRLCDFDSTPGAANEPLRDLFLDREGFDAWAARYRQRLQAEQSVDAQRSAVMRLANPKFVLRNHLAEVAIRQAREGDFSEVQRLHRLLQQPFEEQPGNEAYAGFPPSWAHQLEVSCSS